MGAKKKRKKKKPSTRRSPPRGWAKWPKEKLLEFLGAIRDVFGGYEYYDYDEIIVRDLLNRSKLMVGNSTMRLYQEKKLTEEQIMESGFSVESKDANMFDNAIEIIGIGSS